MADMANNAACQLCLHKLPGTQKFQVFQQTAGTSSFSKHFQNYHEYYWVFRLIIHDEFEAHLKFRELLDGLPILHHHQHKKVHKYFALCLRRQI